MALPTGATGGERLGPYRLLRGLGVGAMGQVFLAEDEEGERQVALKVFHPHVTARPGFLERLRGEAQAGSRIQDPHVVRTYEACVLPPREHPTCFLVMEYVEGRTLRELLLEMGVVPEGLVREIGRQVAHGLGAIHRAGLVHRDLKPENVLITQDEVVRIMDLGVAKVLDQTSTQTDEGRFRGSLLYAAPESLRSTDLAPPSDLYSLGVVLYELACGHNPFRRDTIPGILHAHLHERAPPLLDTDAEVSLFLSEVLEALLSKEPSERFADAEAVERLLEEGERSRWWSGRNAELLRRRARIPRVNVHRETRLYGRERELGALREAWRRARDGQGNSVLLVGEAGIGKSRLADALVQEVAQDEPHILYGSYPPSGGAGALSEAVAQKFGTEDLAAQLLPYLARAPRLAPLAAAVLKGEAPPADSPALEGGAIHAALVHLMHGLAAERPLLWIVEDLHFAAGEGRGIALSLARAVEGHRVLLVLTTRPRLGDDDQVLLGRIEHLNRIELPRLGARDVVLLVRDAFQSDRVAERLGGRIALHSDGNPFFVFETLRGLRQSNLVAQLPDGTWIDTQTIEAIPVPAAVRDLVEARLQRVGQRQRALLDVGAVLGFGFDPSIVAAVLDVKPIHVLQELAHVERSSGVVRAVGREYCFDHHQIQEVVYAGLGQPLREAYHAEAARVLEGRWPSPHGEEAVRICEHAGLGQQGEMMLRHLDAALEHLRVSWQSERAVALCDLALAIPELLTGERRLQVLIHMEDRLDILGRRDEQARVIAEAEAQAELLDAGELGIQVQAARAELLMWTGRPEEARACYDSCLAFYRAAGDRAGEGRICGRLGNTFWAQGRFEDARSCYELALAIGRERGDLPSEARALSNLAKALMGLSRFEEARTLQERALESFRATRDLVGEASALSGLGNIHSSLGQFQEALPYFERQLALCRESGDRRNESIASGNLGLMLSHLGDQGAARRHCLRQQEIAREMGDVRNEAYARGNLAGVSWQLGQLDDAERQYRAQRELFVAVGELRGQGAAIANLGNLQRLRGAYEEARATFDAGLVLLRECGDRRLEAWVLHGLGSVEECAGRLEDARRWYEEAVELREAIGHHAGAAESRLHLARVCQALGARERAALLCTQVREAEPASVLPPLRGLAACRLAALGMLASERAREVLDQRQAGWESPVLLECHLCLWEATGEAHDLEEAQALLEKIVEEVEEPWRGRIRVSEPPYRAVLAASRSLRPGGPPDDRGG